MNKLKEPSKGLFSNLDNTTTLAIYKITD